MSNMCSKVITKDSPNKALWVEFTTELMIEAVSLANQRTGDTLFRAISYESYAERIPDLKEFIACIKDCVVWGEIPLQRVTSVEFTSKIKDDILTNLEPIFIKKPGLSKPYAIYIPPACGLEIIMGLDHFTSSAETPSDLEEISRYLVDIIPSIHCVSMDISKPSFNSKNLVNAFDITDNLVLLVNVNLKEVGLLCSPTLLKRISAKLVAICPELAEYAQRRKVDSSLDRTSGNDVVPPESYIYDTPTALSSINSPPEPSEELEQEKLHRSPKSSKEIEQPNIDDNHEARHDAGGHKEGPKKESVGPHLITHQNIDEDARKSFAALDSQAVWDAVKNNRFFEHFYDGIPPEPRVKAAIRIQWPRGGKKPPHGSTFLTPIENLPPVRGGIVFVPEKALDVYDMKREAERIAFGIRYDVPVSFKRRNTINILEADFSEVPGFVGKGHPVRIIYKQDSEGGILESIIAFSQSDYNWAFPIVLEGALRGTHRSPLHHPSRPLEDLQDELVFDSMDRATHPDRS